MSIKILNNNKKLQYEWYFEEEEGSPPAEPPGAEPPAPASRDLLIHNVKKIEGNAIIYLMFFIYRVYIHLYYNKYNSLKLCGPSWRNRHGL